MNELQKAGLLAAVVVGMSSPLAHAVDQDIINRAIAGGVIALRGTQGAEGTWQHHEIGATALAGLTLLECGVSANDRTVLGAIAAVRRASVTTTHTYSISLAILFFDRLGDPDDIALIESLTVRLLAGQTSSGGWNYTCPAISEAEARRLLANLVQRKQLVGRRQPPKPGDVKRTVKDLSKEIQQQLAALERAGGGVQQARSDNSNTQFATLALWVGRRYGLPVEKALRRVETRFRNSQNADGGWEYFDQSMLGMGPRGGSTATMTCAGLLGLAVGKGTALEARQDKEGKPAREIDKDAAVRKALLALGASIGHPQGLQRRRGDRPMIQQVGGRTYYFLWSLERVAVALDLNTIGKKDWYAWGAEILLANQQIDGSWRGDYGNWASDTCFALLFLKRANLALDLTTQLTGRIPDPGERILRPGGIGGDSLREGKAADLKSGIEGKESKPVASAEQKPPEKVNPADSASARLAKELVKATGSRHTVILNQMRVGTGVMFTEALALAIPQLKIEKQRQAREALAERLSRMKAETLVNYLEDEDIEIRRAAALACALKESKMLVPNLIPLLRDPERLVSRAVHAALKDLTSQDFGPAPDATREDRDQAVRKWLEWWGKQERK
jgi:HEAT repeats